VNALGLGAVIAAEEVRNDGCPHRLERDRLAILSRFRVHLNDPYYWKAEFYNGWTGHLLACRF
jgi:hypothetical protein